MPHAKHVTCPECFRQFVHPLRISGVFLGDYVRCPNCKAIIKVQECTTDEGTALDADVALLDFAHGFHPAYMNVNMIELQQRIGTFWDGGPFDPRPSKADQYEALFKDRAKLATIDFGRFELMAHAAYMCRCADPSYKEE